MEIVLPKRAAHRPSKASNAKYQADLRAFADQIINLNRGLSIRVSARGWCYILEKEAKLGKGDFNLAERLITNCRKEGLLPVDICSEDNGRVSEGVQGIDPRGAADQAEHLIEDLIDNAANDYTPYFFTDYQSCYIEMYVEKIDLKEVFRPICNRYHIPIANTSGSPDVNQRAATIDRFKAWGSRGKHCVLLYCGDLDPYGLLISDNLRNNFKEVSKTMDWTPDNLHIERFGLNRAFVDQRGFTWIENLETSGGEIAVLGADGKPKPGIMRTGGNKGNSHPMFCHEHVQRWLNEIGIRKVEANQLVTDVEAGQQLCEDAILKYIDIEGVKQYNKDTQAARDQLQSELNNRINI